MIFFPLIALIHMINGQSVEVRIVGGDSTDDEEYPYFIFWEGCGATLIHNDIALSAAHVSFCYEGHRTIAHPSLCI